MPSTVVWMVEAMSGVHRVDMARAFPQTETLSQKFRVPAPVTFQEALSCPPLRPPQPRTLRHPRTSSLQPDRWAFSSHLEVLDTMPAPNQAFRGASLYSGIFDASEPPKESQPNASNPQAPTTSTSQPSESETALNQSEGSESAAAATATTTTTTSDAAGPSKSSGTLRKAISSAHTHTAALLCCG